MSENLCPYNNNCPAVISVAGDLKRTEDKLDLQNKYIVEKLEDMSADLREIKIFLNEKLDAKIDERIERKLNAYQAKILRWIIMTLLGSGGLSALIAFLIK